MANNKLRRISEFDFKPFSEKQMKLFTCWHEDSPVSDKFLVVADGSIRSGKEQPNDARIYTKDGWKPMGKIRPRDMVIGRDGKLTKVINVYPQGKKPVYEIIFSDGSKTECGKEHLWLYKNNKTPSMWKKEHVKTLNEILKEDKRNNLCFPICDPVEFCGKSVERPYTLGAILVCGIKKDKWIISTESEYAHNLVKEENEDYLPAYTYGVGVAEVEYNHEIDEKIIYSPLEDRMKIAKTIIQAKGVVKIKEVAINFLNKDYMSLFIDIARSLGLVISRDKYNPNFRCELKITPRLLKYFSEEQKQYDIEMEKYGEYKRITQIRHIGMKECTCIEVANKEHLYLTDDFIVTHNTVAMSLSFVMFVQSHFSEMNAAICGKSVGAARRNIIQPLKSMLLSLGYDIVDHKSENYLEITSDGVTNYYFIFGGESLPPLYRNILKINSANSGNILMKKIPR